LESNRLQPEGLPTHKPSAAEDLMADELMLFDKFCKTGQSISAPPQETANPQKILKKHFFKRRLILGIMSHHPRCMGFPMVDLIKNQHQEVSTASEVHCNGL
jgi:hypothetical protein